MDTKDIIEILALHIDGSVEQWERTSKTACFSGARACKGKLGEFHLYTYPMSFLWAELYNVPNVAAALISLYGPFIALSETVPEYFNLEHTSNLAFADAVEASGELQFLGAAILNAELSFDDRERLGQLNGMWSYNNMKYWRPETLGQALFNWWD